MESLLTRLVTYKLMDGSSLVNNFINQPIGKLLFALLLFTSIVASSIYILRRTLFQNKLLYSKGSKFSISDPQDLINLWIEENHHFCSEILNICLAFVNSHNDKVKVGDLFTVSSLIFLRFRMESKVSTSYLVYLVLYCIPS